MIALLLTALFAASGALAISTIARSWRRYGATALALRDQLRECPEWRDVTVTVTAIKVHPGGATILRPAFRIRDWSRSSANVLPAAA